MTTILQALFREVENVFYVKENFELPDGDFLELDWIRNGSGKLVVLLHGLEGNARSGYLQSMAKTVSAENWDVLAINFRGCGTKPNRLYRSYHSGETNDLHSVLTYVSSKYNYHRMALIGFSLGGNVLLKYLGERGKNLLPEIYSAAAVSVPCDLQASVDQLNRFSNQLYQSHFLRSLKQKLVLKAQFQEATFGKKEIDGVSTIRQFDDLYTAPAHGFKSAEDYWAKSSCKKFLPGIGVPTLLINAQDDPFLAPECYPIDEAFAHQYLHLEMPAKGGHIGFLGAPKDDTPWHEKRIVRFFWKLGFENEALLVKTA